MAVLRHAVGLVCVVAVAGCAGRLTPRPRGAIDETTPPILDASQAPPVPWSAGTNAVASLRVAVDGATEADPTGCYSIARARADEYNEIALTVWHLDFWTAMVGIVGSSTAAALLSVGNSMYNDPMMMSGTDEDLTIAASVVTGMTAVFTGTLVAVIGASGVRARQADLRASFDRADGVRTRTIDHYAASLDARIRASVAEAQAEALFELQGLTALTRSQCR